MRALPKNLSLSINSVNRLHTQMVNTTPSPSSYLFAEYAMAISGWRGTYVSDNTFYLQEQLTKSDVKDIFAVLAVADVPQGRMIDFVRRQNPDFLGCTDDYLVSVLYKAMMYKHKDIFEYVKNTLLWENPDFLGYTDDDFVLVRYEEVEKLSLAEYIDRLRVKSTQE